MGKTFKRNDRWKKDRRDNNFKKSKKFKDFQHGHKHPHKPVELPPMEVEEYDISRMDANI